MRDQRSKRNSCNTLIAKRLIGYEPKVNIEDYIKELLMSKNLVYMVMLINHDTSTYRIIGLLSILYMSWEKNGVIKIILTF